MTSTGELIRENRIRKGWSQTVLGNLAGIDHVLVQRIENGEVLPDEEQANRIAGLLYIDHEHLQQIRTRASTPHLPYALQWENTHPASYAGSVWIQIRPMPDARAVEHRFSLRWGAWQRQGVFSLASGQTHIVLLHYKHDDGLGLPLYVQLSHPCYVLFGRGTAPQGQHIDINQQWQRVEPPSPAQFWRYVRHFLGWYLRRLIGRAGS